MYTVGISTTYTLITGASSGIGEAVARKLASEDRSLILIARRSDRLQALKSELGLTGVGMRLGAFDVTDESALTAFFADLKGISIDTVVNNAGLALGTETFDQYDFADAKRMVDVNITAFMRIAHLALPFLKQSRGHLVNLGSIAGLETYAGGTVYAATKHFVHAFTEGLRKDLMGSGVRVTTIAPGRVDTEFSVVRLKGDKKKADAVYQGYRPLHADDIADAVWYAVSRPAHVNIEQILVMPTDQAGLQVAPMR